MPIPANRINLRILPIKANNRSQTWPRSYSTVSMELYIALDQILQENWVPITSHSHTEHTLDQPDTAHKELAGIALVASHRRKTATT